MQANQSAGPARPEAKGIQDLFGVIRKAQVALPPGIAKLVTEELRWAQNFFWLNGREWHLRMAEEVRQLHAGAMRDLAVPYLEELIESLDVLEIRSGRGSKSDARLLLERLHAQGLRLVEIPAEEKEAA